MAASNKNDPLSIDFAALRTLCSVHSQNSFSGAAEVLDLSQSMVSYTIERLRRAYDDPLFVRQGGAITPTQRCEEIVAAAEQIVDQYCTMVQPTEFTPLTATATVRISSNYYERVTLLPALIKALRVHSPGIQLEMLQSLTEGHDQLKAGKTDILLTPVETDESGFYTRKLFSEYYVCVMDRDNPLARKPLTEELYCSANHALVSYGSKWRSTYLTELEAKGHSLRQTLCIPSPENMSGLLAGTDMISTVPSRIAHRITDQLVVRDCPFRGEFNILMYWTARTHHSKMHLWLRGMIADTVAEVVRKADHIE
ncbi:MAG: DNA-binding transcriptional LysR family regulator [Pseudorhodobacter sp.]